MGQLLFGFLHYLTGEIVLVFYLVHPHITVRLTVCPSV